MIQIIYCKYRYISSGHGGRFFFLKDIYQHSLRNIKLFYLNNRYQYHYVDIFSIIGIPLNSATPPILMRTLSVISQMGLISIPGVRYLLPWVLSMATLSHSQTFRLNIFLQITVLIKSLDTIHSLKLIRRDLTGQKSIAVDDICVHLPSRKITSGKIYTHISPQNGSFHALPSLLFE